ncbi:MAG: pstP [Gammaproteobacteria bacterium]|nr:pstP [Gammaproteobacteria bacterium]
MQTATAVGFYGKLPCNGDFLQRRVPQEFIDVWDPWLQECLHASREVLREAWLNAYLTSPVWRFVLAEGVCGSGAYAGVMLPSVDRVGRYFPLTLVAQLNVDDCVLEIACDAAQKWFASAEALALGALEAVDLDLATFDTEVASLADQMGPYNTAEAAYLRGLMQKSEFGRHAAQWHTPLGSAQSLQRAVNVFASRELERTLRPLALWWTDGSNAIAPGLLCNRGLPPAASFVAMIAADWARAGWVSLDPSPERDRGGGHVAPPFVPTEAALATVPEAALALAPESFLSPALEPITSPAAPLAPTLAPDTAEFRPIELLAWHEPVSRTWGSGASRAHFVARPDLGLWGVTCSQPADDQAIAAQAVMDVLQSVPQAATLSSLVEDVRRALERVQQQLERPAATLAAPAPRIILFLARDAECALVYAGEVQAIRYRCTDVTQMVGAASGTDYGSIPAAADPGASLMDLIATPAVLQASIRVQYESLHSGDTWVLAGAPLLEQPSLSGIAPALTAEDILPEAAFAALRGISRLARSGTDGAFPVLLLAARPAPQD